MIKVVTNFADFKQLESEWDLLYSDGSYMPFQSFDYNYLSWRDFSNEGCMLYIVCYYAEQENSACAIFPFCIDSHMCLRFMNDNHTDYQTALIRVDFRTNYSMYEEVFGLLMQESRFNRIFLNHLMHNDLLIPYFGHFNRNAKIYRTENYSFFSVNSLPADKTYIDCLRHLTAKERNRLKNTEKKMVNSEVRILSAINGDEYPEETIEMLIQTMIEHGIRTEEYFAPALRLLFKDLYNTKLLAIALIMDDGKVGSASLFYRYNMDKDYIQWVILYADKKYNLWNKLKILEYMYGKGGGVFNFGRGAYPYKVQHFKPVIQNLFCIDLSKSDCLRYVLQVKDNCNLLKSIISRSLHHFINKCFS